MAKWREKDKRNKCKICASPAKPNGLSKSGDKTYKVYCDKHWRENTASGKRKKTISNSRLFPDHPYRIFKKASCEHCGFLPIHECQLDVDHIDGNHKNNSPENFQTLCANCHRLKTFVKSEGIYK